MTVNGADINLKLGIRALRQQDANAVSSAERKGSSSKMQNRRQPTNCQRQRLQHWLAGAKPCLQQGLGTAGGQSGH